MPLLHKPRDPNYGVRKVRRRHVIWRKRIQASVLPETKEYLETQQKMTSQGQVIDAAVKLYAECRELSRVSKSERGSVRLQAVSTSVSQETWAYIQYMSSAMTPGELIDAAVMLYKELKNQGQ